MDKVKQFIAWLIKAIGYVAIFDGWPFLLVGLFFFFYAGGFSTAIAWMLIGAFIALSWKQIKQGIVKLWNDNK